MNLGLEFDRCFGCGAHNPVGLHLRQHSRIVGDDMVIDANLGPFYAGFAGVAHAGVVATMIDEAIQLHAFGVLGLIAPTAELNIAYKAPVPTETPLQVRGHGVRDGHKVLSTAEVMDEAGRVLVSAEAVLIVQEKAPADLREKARTP